MRQKWPMLSEARPAVKLRGVMAGGGLGAQGPVGVVLPGCWLHGRVSFVKIH